MTIIFVAIPAILLVIGGLGVFIAISMKKGASGIKVMLLGLQITLIGGILAIDPESSLGGLEYFICLAGLVISIIGLVKNSGNQDIHE